MELLGLKGARAATAYKLKSSRTVTNCWCLKSKFDAILSLKRSADKGRLQAHPKCPQLSDYSLIEGGMQHDLINNSFFFFFLAKL